MASVKVRLDAESLYSKFGFMDGDMFEVGDHSHEFLAGMVMAHLLPACRQALGSPLSVLFINTGHNPIRAKANWNGDSACPNKLIGVYVEVDVDEALLDAEYLEMHHGRR